VVGEVDVRNLATFSAEFGEEIFELLNHPEFEAQAITLGVADVIGVGIVSDLTTSLRDLCIAQGNFQGVVRGSDSLQIELTLLNANRSLSIGDDGKKDQRAENVRARGDEGLVTLLRKLFFIN